MRLIDANALLKCIPAEELVSRIAIANAPTINTKKDELAEDGTLYLETEHDLFKVKRINVSQIGTKWGDMYYQDEEG